MKPRRTIVPKIITSASRKETGFKFLELELVLRVIVRVGLAEVVQQIKQGAITTTRTGKISKPVVVVAIRARLVLSVLRITRLNYPIWCKNLILLMRRRGLSGRGLVLFRARLRFAWKLVSLRGRLMFAWRVVVEEGICMRLWGLGFVLRVLV